MMLDEIERWVVMLKAGDKSLTTISGYAWELRRLAASRPEKSPADYTLDDLNAYLASRREAGAGAASRKRAVAAARGFFRWARGGREQSPAEGLVFPQVARHEQRSLTAEQSRAVLAACDPLSLRGKRDLAMLALMLDSGIRASEVCRVRLEDVEVERRRFTVQVKSGKRLKKSYSATTAVYLRWWLEARQDVAQVGVGTVFVGVGGNKRGTPLTTGGLRAIFRDIGRRAGLTGGFSPHDLRRSLAMLSTGWGAPTRTLQVQGGWENMEEIETYTRALALDAFEPYFPLDRLAAPAVPPAKNGP